MPKSYQSQVVRKGAEFQFRLRQADAVNWAFCMSPFSNYRYSILPGVPEVKPFLRIFYRKNVVLKQQLTLVVSAHPGHHDFGVNFHTPVNDPFDL